MNEIYNHDIVKSEKNGLFFAAHHFYFSQTGLRICIHYNYTTDSKSTIRNAFYLSFSSLKMLQLIAWCSEGLDKKKSEKILKWVVDFYFCSIQLSLSKKK